MVKNPHTGVASFAASYSALFFTHLPTYQWHPPIGEASTAPMVQPPSPVQEKATGPATMPPINRLINKLHDLIHKIPLPKTRAAKTAVVTVNVLHSTCELITSASALVSLAVHQECPQLSNINRQLEVIMAHLAAPSMSQTGKDHSYASILTMDMQHPIKAVSPGLNSHISSLPPSPPHPCPF